MKEEENKRGRWLNRYGFAYTGRDTVNIGLATFKEIAPSLIETTINVRIRWPKKEYNS